MAQISNIIQVAVSVSRAAPSRAAFGIPLVVPPVHSVFSERVRTYSSLSGLTDDGFARTSPAYLWAQALFSQTPRPAKIKIGRVDAADANLTDALDAIYAADPKFWAILAPVTYDATASTEQSGVMNVAAWAEAKRVGYLAESGAGNLLASGANLASALKSAGYSRTALWYHGVQKQVVKLTIDGPFVTGNVIDVKVNGTAITSVVFATDSDTTLAALATAIQGNSAVGTAVVTTESATTSDDREIVITAASPWEDVELAGFAVELGATQPSASIVETTPSEAPLSASIAGRCLAKDPGSVNWANQANLAGVNPDNLSQTAIGVLELQRANYYAPFTDDLAFTRLGTTAATYYLDSLRGLDALVTDLEDALLSMFANTDKVPATSDGKEIVRKELVSVLQRHKRAGFLTGDVEQAVDMTAAAFTGRNLTGIEINALGAGAINGVAIKINFKE